jgi:hypothetical protein
MHRPGLASTPNRFPGCALQQAQKDSGPILIGGTQRNQRGPVGCGTDQPVLLRDRGEVCSSALFFAGAWERMRVETWVKKHTFRVLGKQATRSTTHHSRRGTQSGTVDDYSQGPYNLSPSRFRLLSRPDRHTRGCEWLYHIRTEYTR